MRRQFRSIVFKSVGGVLEYSNNFLRSNMISNWNFNFSYLNLKSDLLFKDCLIFKDFTKAYIYEEGKRIYSKKAHIAFPFFLRFYNRKFKGDVLLDTLSFFSNIFLKVNFLGSFSTVVFVLNFSILVFFFKFFFFFLLSFIYLFDSLFIFLIRQRACNNS